MTPEQAITKTSQKFTNLFGGGVKNGVSVETILEYYTSCIADTPINVKIHSSFEDNFHNEMCQEIENEYYDQFGYDEV